MRRGKELSSPGLIGIYMLIFVATRIVLLLVSQKVYINDVEELFRGNLAVDIISGGRLLPFDQYIQTFSYPHGASICVSSITVALFYLLGSSFTSLKLGALTIATLTALLLFLVAQRLVNKKTALVAFLLYLFPAAIVDYQQLWAHINHHILFACTLAMLLFFRGVLYPQKGRELRGIAVLGVVMGFSVFCWGSNCIAAVIIASFCAYEWRTHAIRALMTRIGILSVGCLLGAMPLLYRGRHIVGFMSSSYPGTRIDFHRFIHRAYIVVCPALLQAFKVWKQSNIPWHWFAYAAAVAAYAWILYTLVSRRKITGLYLRLFLACYPVLYISFIALSGFTDAYGFKKTAAPSPFGLRYVCPLISIFIPAGAIMICDLIAHKSMVLKMAGRAILIFWILFGLQSYYSIVSDPRIGYGLRQPGYFAQEIGCRITEQSLDDWSRFTPLMERVLAKKETTLRNDIARGAAWLTCLYRITDNEFHVSNPEKFRVYIRIVEKHVPVGLQLLFKEEIGSFVFWHTNYDVKLSLDKLAQGLGASDAELSYIGMARVLPMWTTEPSKLEDAIYAIPLKDKNRLAYAMGQYFSAMPDQEASVYNIAGNISEREPFINGSRDPFGTRMYWPPIHCH